MYGLPYKTCRYPLFLFRNRLPSLPDILQQPCHVSAKHAHGLQTFGILQRFTGKTAMHAVPILGRNHRHIIDGKVLVQTVEHGTCTATATAAAGLYCNIPPQE